MTIESDSRSINAQQGVLRRLSFGHNGGKTPNSSTAVACGLILNYLDRTFDNRVLPQKFKAEDLKGSDYSFLRYMGTDWLHHYLLGTCQLAPGPFGRWGKSVVDRFERYWQARPWAPGVVVRCKFGGYGAKKAWKLAKREIDADRPAMITVRRSKLAGGKPRWHTFVVCGYRTTAIGRHELFVHTGMYGDHVKGSRAQLIYIPLKDIVCSYCFKVVLRGSATHRHSRAEV